MFAGRPTIGLTGGIGSGKSFVASLFAELGCVVIDSDKLVSVVYRNPAVVAEVRNWWGDSAVQPDGTVNRKEIAHRIFSNSTERDRLESLLHPQVAAARARAMQESENDAQVLAFVWDTPLLFETGLSAECDAIVFVDAPDELRLARVIGGRKWTQQELAAREKSQWPLEKKRRLSHYVIKNSVDKEFARGQVWETLSRILETNRLGRYRMAEG